MIGRSSFQPLNDAVIRTTGHDSQPIPYCIGRLMMRRIHQYRNPALDPGPQTSAPRGDETCDPRVRVDFNAMGDGNLPSGFMIHFRASRFRQKIRNMLNERSSAKNVQALQAITNAKDGLPMQVRVFEEKIVYCLPSQISANCVA